MHIGFIGLGVMGEPMCRNLATKSGAIMMAADISQAPLERLAAHNVTATTVAYIAREADVVFMALPSGVQVEAVCRELLGSMKLGSLLVDLGTSPLKLTRELAAAFEGTGVRYADAPVARTRQAAEDGTLSVMVGATPEVFTELAPLLAHIGSDVTHFGPVGCGQLAKIANNLVLIQTVVGLSEALALAKEADMDGRLLFETLSKGSADSFALRNHGLKAIIPDVFPEPAFSVEYALKDLSYAQALAREAGIELRGADAAETILKQAIEAGFGKLYWPVISRVIAKS